MDNIKELVLGRQKQFLEDVENLVWKLDVSYLEAVTKLMQERDLEPEAVAQLIVGDLKDRIESEAMSLSLVKRRNILG